MDYQYILLQTDPETARRLDAGIDDSEYKRADPETLDDLTRGAVVLGMETIDYPLTDGMIIYLKRPAGDVIGVLFEVDGAEQQGGIYELLSTKTATIQERGICF